MPVVSQEKAIGQLPYSLGYLNLAEEVDADVADKGSWR